MQGQMDPALDPALQGRMGIYLNAYRARLRDALADNYPVLSRALGDAAFDELAWAYSAQYPSRQRSIRWYGDNLLEFLQQHPQHVAHPALADLAQMDWAMRNAFDAADAPLLQLADVAALPAQDWPALSLQTQPSCCLLRLSWAIQGLWQTLNADPDAQSDPPLAQETVIVLWRGPELNCHWRSATALEATVWQHLESGLSFAKLCELLQAQPLSDPAQTAVQLLQQWLTDGLLTGPVRLDTRF